MRWDDLPAGSRSFPEIDPATRQLIGHPHIYAPGDAGDFPVKSAFLALLQADTVAEHITHLVLGRPFAAPLDPVRCA
jgi:sulfide:quinone oxidoreductase